MIEQQARVVRIENGDAWVSVGGQSGCSACDAGKGCGAGIFGRLLRRKPVQLALPNSIAARAGQAVTLGLPESLFLRLVMRLYGWPLLGGLAGALISHQIGEKFQAASGVLDALTLAGLAGGGAAVLLLLRRRGARLPEGQIVMLADAPGGECNSAQAQRSV